MTWDTKSRLIKSDPVSVARYFDNRVQQFFSQFLLSPVAPIGNVKDFFYRIEFQNRGSPYIHGLLWVEDAPQKDKDSDKDIEDFVTKHISTDKSNPLAKYQMHRHSHTCKKGKKKQCRFNFPLPPMNRTRLLRPEKGVTPEEIETHKLDLATINNKIDDLGMGEEIDFKDFLKSMNMSKKRYLTALKSTLTDPKIFLERSPNAIRVNGYSPCIMTAWLANHDIQYVLDAYACAMYIVSYISKKPAWNEPAAP